MSNEYYVYMYIDPRNNVEFYYGKGRGKRKFSHLRGKLDNEKNRRIRAIRKAGEEPIIKVIAAGLTEEEALLVSELTSQKPIQQCVQQRSKKLACHVELGAGLSGSYFKSGGKD